MKQKKFRLVLLVVNLLIWSVVLTGFLKNQWNQKRNEDLIASHHELVKEINSFRNYEDYEEKIPLMETKMTKEVMEQVCPIIPEDFMDEFPEPKVTQLKTEDIKKVNSKQKKLITAFSLSLNNKAPFTQRTESVYEKRADKWVMISYQLIF